MMTQQEQLASRSLQLLKLLQSDLFPEAIVIGDGAAAADSYAGPVFGQPMVHVVMYDTGADSGYMGHLMESVGFAPNGERRGLDERGRVMGELRARLDVEAPLRSYINAGMTVRDVEIETLLLDLMTDDQLDSFFDRAKYTMDFVNEDGGLARLHFVDDIAAFVAGQPMSHMRSVYDGVGVYHSVVNPAFNRVVVASHHREMQRIVARHPGISLGEYSLTGGYDLFTDEPVAHTLRGIVKDILGDPEDEYANMGDLDVEEIKSWARDFHEANSKADADKLAELMDSKKDTWADIIKKARKVQQNIAATAPAAPDDVEDEDEDEDEDAPSGPAVIKVPVHSGADILRQLANNTQPSYGDETEVSLPSCDDGEDIPF